MTTMNRRRLLAGAAAVPLLPTAAVAKSLNVQTPDRALGEIDWAVFQRIFL